MFTFPSGATVLRKDLRDFRLRPGLALVLCALLLAHLALGAAMGLSVDEAHYLLYAAHPDWSAAKVAEAGFGLEQSRKGAQCVRPAPRAHTPTDTHASVVRSHMHRPLYPACLCMPRV